VNEREEEIVICRCEEVTLGEIREWIDRGYQTFDELKRDDPEGVIAENGKTCLRDPPRYFQAPLQTGQTVASSRWRGYVMTLKRRIS